MEIVQGIHRIPCIFDGNRVMFVHLLVGTKKIMLVDTCLAHNPEQEIFPYMQQLGIQPSQINYVLISHSDSDHVGGNRIVKDHAPNSMFMCHKLDRPWVEDVTALLEGRYKQFDRPHGMSTPDSFVHQLYHDVKTCPMDMTLEGGEQIWLSEDWYVDVLHTPGHTWGHLSVYDPRSHALIAGEAALWNAILDKDWQPCMAPTYCYADTYLATIQRLLAMSIDVYSPSHWPLQMGKEVHDFLYESRNYCLRVEEELLNLSQRTESFTMLQAIDEICGLLGTWSPVANNAMAYPINANIARLVQRGQLEQSHNDQGHVIWRRA